MAKLQIKLVKSPAGRNEKHIRTIRALGLKKVDSSVVQEATPQIMGMIRKVGYLLSVEEVSE